MEPLFLSLDEVLEIHAQQVELYGGSDGVRDPAGLESGVATPMATFGGQFLHSTIPSIAAVLKMASHATSQPDARRVVVQDDGAQDDGALAAGHSSG